MKAKFKQGDRARHIFTKELFLIIAVSIKCAENCNGNCMGICKPKRFAGHYTVLHKDYTERNFPEWQLEANE